MELYDVEPLRLAHPLTPAKIRTQTQWLGIAVTALIALRFVAAALLPLSFDEAYYWLWSKHLALSYYDHPPVVAYAIRLGTFLFGNSVLGVRFVPLLFSAGASWAVWRAGSLLLDDSAAGGRAALFFNLTLMATVETMTATPDAPLMFGAALFVLALAKLERTGEARWWLAAGAAGGFALLSKYTALFLGAGALAYLFGTRAGRRWKTTPWPYLGATLAFALFAPVIWWNAQHGWISFRFQFAKAGGGHFAPHFLGEFLAAQIALASPFLFVLGTVGLARWKGTGSALLTALALPAVLFFCEHALHARVQGNWPSFLYSAFAIAAAAASGAGRSGWLAWVVRVSTRWAVPVALLFLAVAYGQALTGFLPMRDPTAHLLASGFEPVAQRIDALRADNHANAVLTTSYGTAGWLAFYLPGHPPVIQWNEPYRWLAARKAGAAVLGKPLIYVVEPRRDRAARLGEAFAHVRLLARLTRRRNDRAVSRYNVYLLSGWHGVPAGRITNAP